MKKVLKKIKLFLKRVKLFFTGVVIHRAVNSFFSYIITPLFVAAFDVATCILVLSLISVVRSRVLLWMYDRIQKDIFLLHAMQERRKKRRETLQTHEGVRNRRLKLGILKTNNMFIFFVFMLWDPTIVAIYYRGPMNSFQGLIEKKIKILFYLSSFLSTVVVVLGWKGFTILIKYFE